MEHQQPIHSFPLFSLICYSINKAHVKRVESPQCANASPLNPPTVARLSETGRSRRMINVPPLTPHCELERTGRNYFSRWAGARSWRKNRANTVYHLPDDSPPRGELTTRPYRLARAGSQCPFTLINLPMFLFQLYQSNLSEDTQHWSVNTAYYCNTHTCTRTGVLD